MASGSITNTAAWTQSIQSKESAGKDLRAVPHRCFHASPLNLYKTPPHNTKNTSKTTAWNFVVVQHLRPSQTHAVDRGLCQQNLAGHQDNHQNE
eukprot:719672-Amphidinium_carterae.1